MSPQGDTCFCRAGYELERDRRTCRDVNECRIPGHCSQGCSNTVGSFKCICADGYRLVNGTRCLVEGPEPLMVFSDGDSLRGLYMRSNRYFPIHDAVDRIHGLDMSDNGRIYWADTGEEKSGVYSCNLDGSDRRGIITAGLKEAEDVALDWVAGNLYITDSGLGKIIVCKQDGSVCSVLFDKVDRPRALAVDSVQGYLFWTQWGKLPGVYSSALDGSGKETLVNTSIEWPNGLTFDTVKSRVYWCDAKLNKIEYYDMLDKTRHVVVEDTVFHPFSMSVFEDRIYWGDWITYSLDAADKFTGRNQVTILREAGKSFMGIHVFHPVHHATTVTSPCFSTLCSHLCLISPRKQYTCACPDHMTLADNGLSCIPTLKSFALVGLERKVKQLYPESIGHDVLQDISMPAHLSIGDFTFDSIHNIIYVFDLNKYVILSIDLETASQRSGARRGSSSASIKSSESGLTSVSGTKTIIDSHLNAVHGLTFDCHTHNLYWLEGNAGRLEVASVETKTRATLISDLERPIDLVLDPLRTSLYIANLGSEPYILRADMDGFNQKKIASGHSIGLPVSLFLLENSNGLNQLFWADAKFGTIESLDLTTTAIESGKRGIVRERLGHVMSLGIMNGTLYWTDMDNGYLYHSPLWDKSSKPTQVPFPDSVHGTSTVKKIRMVRQDSLEAVEEIGCAVNNGNCSHLCLLGKFCRGDTC